MNIDRRTVVGGMVAAGATVTLAACAAEPEPVETTPPSATVDQQPTQAAGELLLGPASDVMVG